MHVAVDWMFWTKPSIQRVKGGRWIDRERGREKQRSNMSEKQILETDGETQRQRDQYKTILIAMASILFKNRRNIY